MTFRAIRLGLDRVPKTDRRPSGELVEWRDATYYRLTHYDAMDPFLVSVVTDTDLWMYVSSNGGLTAGRRDAERALFPYETVDKLHLAHTHTGPKTIIRTVGSKETFIWQPFAESGHLLYEIDRSLSKHVLGCELWFEERNRSLGLSFRYGWQSSDRFGWVRSTEIVNDSENERHIEILDGVQNLLPAGTGTRLQNSLSCLVDAYKMAGTDPATGVTVYRLSSNIVDRPEASEALRATVAWHVGLGNASVVLSDTCGEGFIRTGDVPRETNRHGRRAAYLLKTDISLAAKSTQSWHIALDTAVDQRRVVNVLGAVATGAAPLLTADIRSGQNRLRRLLAAADALQETGDAIAATHHITNVLYNIARGGVLPHQYAIDRSDLVRFVRTRNRPLADHYAAWLAELPTVVSLPDLHRRAEVTGELSLIRICMEYIPIVFARRHGDPSRPWNQFSIRTKHADGSALYAYEGNWRDIFQNWEALCRSFPECLEPIIAKFVNASTLDGFNPYRITHEGIDWEISDPDDPWSSIGYWGDHQIVYLTRLIEASLAHHPERLCAMLTRDWFSYADVPYDIKPYTEIVTDPRHTIDFNWERHQASDERVAAIGTDGKLVHQDGEILQVNLAEKLIVPILAKLSNLVPEGGIWMNTMRPEWNDANNALAGNGLSVVSTCYLHRHLGVCADLIDRCRADSVELSTRLAQWLAALDEIVDDHVSGVMDDHRRRSYLDAAGGVFSEYRRTIAEDGPGERRGVAAARIVAMLRRAQHLVAATIRANRRDDDLYHAYNILHLDRTRARVSTLPLMLEGQVAALSSGLLGAEEAARLLDGLRASPLYREDQKSYLLYPVKTLPSYLDKNRVPNAVLERSPALARMVEDGDETILIRDASGQLRFHPDLHNADALRARLAPSLDETDVEAVVDVYEEVFGHKAFTGRSGAMFGYEGIGCIYWHMVAKLLLAVQDAFYQAADGGASADVLGKLKHYYNDVRGGLGFSKDPEVFGALPLEPYSHTPGFGGAKQPGMTGQVKEEILTRWGELGIRVCDGEVQFDPRLLSDSEFLTEPAAFSYVDTAGVSQTLHVPAGSLAFTYCQVPIIYVRGGEAKVTIDTSDGEPICLPGATITADIAAELFGRTGRVQRVTVQLCL